MIFFPGGTLEYKPAAALNVLQKIVKSHYRQVFEYIFSHFEEAKMVDPNLMVNQMGNVHVITHITILA